MKNHNYPYLGEIKEKNSKIKERNKICINLFWLFILKTLVFHLLIILFIRKIINLEK